MAGKKTKGGYDGKIAGLYDLEETIGQGHFAVVKLARHVFTGEKVAVKVIDKQKLDDMSRSHLFQEVRCMKLVQHPNVVRLYEVIDTQTKLYLILELGDGDMYDYIMRHDSGLTEALAKKYFRQIVEAITYCHRLHVVHRDLKPENVVFFDKIGQVKLTDFGFSNVFAPGKKLETSCGSLAYSAPEILLGDSYDPPAVDVWSLGVILFMLVAGNPPFQEANDSETLTMIMDCKYQIPPHVSDLCRRLITKMLVREPSHRINLTDIEGDPWLSSEPGYENHKGISFPLLTSEQISNDDHSYVVQKMVEGKICTREEISLSLEKNAYDHVAATYYLLVERRLRKLHQQHEMMMGSSHHHPHNQANNSNRQYQAAVPSSAAAGNSKPHLEPLMLSPRKKQEVKKTNTAPILKGLHRHHPPSLVISPPVINSEPGAVISPGGPEFVKSLTDSMTLDRHTVGMRRKQKHLQDVRKKNNNNTLGDNNNGSHLPSSGTYSPQSADGSPRNSNLNLLCGEVKKPPPQRVKSAPLTTQGGAKPAVAPKKKAQRPSFSKIAILSSFFERRAAETSGAVKPLQPHQRLLPWREKKWKTQPTLSPISPSFQFGDIHRKGPQGLSGGGAEKESSLVQSLLSPPGTHPSPIGGVSGGNASASSPNKSALTSHLLSPADAAFVGMTRKCSLIHEESHEEEDDDDDFDIDMVELKPSKSLELLDDRASDLSPCTSKELGLGIKNSSHQSHVEPTSSSSTNSPSSSSSTSVNPRRPLKSVCSSPQLLNQIHEENESEDDDDFVPLKLSAPRGRYSHHHTGLASPEIIRKYEQRRRRGGAGSRGTSCSSSDASDTDDTDGRSRKDKLKHKFVHRRDSSDHSSDTDGPSGGSNGGGGGGGGSVGGGSRIGGTRSTTGSKGSKGNGGGGGNGNSGGGGGGGGGGKAHHLHSRQQYHQNLSLNRINNNNSYKTKTSCEDLHDFDHLHFLSEKENIFYSESRLEKDKNSTTITTTRLPPQCCLPSSFPPQPLSDDKYDVDQRLASHCNHNKNINIDLNMNQLFCTTSTNNNHRRNHLSRQKHVICNKEEEDEEEEEEDEEEVEEEEEDEVNDFVSRGISSVSDIGIKLSTIDCIEEDLSLLLNDDDKIGVKPGCQCIIDNNVSVCCCSTDDVDVNDYNGNDVKINSMDNDNDDANNNANNISSNLTTLTTTNTTTISEPTNSSNNNNSKNNNNNNNDTISSTTNHNTNSYDAINGISEFLTSIVMGATSKPPSVIATDTSTTCGVMGSVLAIPCHGQCSHLNNKCLPSSYCKANPGSGPNVLPQMESKCCSVV